MIEKAKKVVIMIKSINNKNRGWKRKSGNKNVTELINFARPMIQCIWNKVRNDYIKLHRYQDHSEILRKK